MPSPPSSKTNVSGKELKAIHAVIPNNMRRPKPPSLSKINLLMEVYNALKIPTPSDVA